MSSHPPQAIALDPAAVAVLRKAVCAALPKLPNEDSDDITARNQLALEILDDLCPTRPTEVLLAAHVVAAHFAAMDAWRRAANGGLSDTAAESLHKDAASMARLSEGAMRLLQRLRNTRRGSRSPAGTGAAQPAATTAAEASAAQDRDAPAAVRHNPLHHVPADAARTGRSDELAAPSRAPAAGLAASDAIAGTDPLHLFGQRQPVARPMADGCAPEALSADPLFGLDPEELAAQFADYSAEELLALARFLEQTAGHGSIRLSTGQLPTGLEPAA